jgi:hypothetical protein
MTDEFDFSNTTAREMVQLLARRADERLSADADHFSAILGAALVVLAEVLRHPIQEAEDPTDAADKMIALSVRWLRQLLQPVTGEH